MRRLVILCLAVLCLFMLDACGRRPQTMDPPEGADTKIYPRHYPDIHTDPAGTYVPATPQK